MKTVIIYDECGEAPIRFYVLDGDYSHLDGIYINHSHHDQAKQEELCNLFYDLETGETLMIGSETFPYEVVMEGFKVIVAGFLP